MERVHRGEDPRLRCDPRCPDRRDAEKPYQRCRSEDRADPGRATALDQEEREEDQNRDRHHVVSEPRRGDLEPLDGAQNRDRGRDHAVAVEERRAEEPERDECRGPPGRGTQERHEGEDASLAAVVGLHDEGEVLEDDHQQERPQHQRQDAEDVRRRRWQAVVGAEALLDRVERRGADVAVHDAQRRQPQRGELPPVGGHLDGCGDVGGERVGGVHPGNVSVREQRPALRHRGEQHTTAIPHLRLPVPGDRSASPQVPAPPAHPQRVRSRRGHGRPSECEPPPPPK